MDAETRIYVESLESKLKQAEERVKELEEYTQHKSTCQRFQGIYGSLTYKPCDCGLDELLKGDKGR